MAHVIHHPSALRAPRHQSAGSILARLAAPFAVWRQRRALAELPAHLREDVGLTEADIHREAARPIWDVPGHWMR